MSIKFFAPSRCALIIGDDALDIYSVTGKSSKLIHSVAWDADGFTNFALTAIRKCGNKPVIIINNMTDQHFKGGQRLPKVGLMDKAGVLKRKLHVAFPNYPIRGAMSVGEKGALGFLKKKDDEFQSGANKPSGDLYLFSAVPMSDPVLKTLGVIRAASNSITGFFLLPTEATDMVYALSKKASGNTDVPARWAIFIGQHRNGALRQVITRDGKLAMTRMTPIIGSDHDPQQWAAEVFQDFKATMSYLSRFGYSEAESTDIFVIANKGPGDALKKMIGSKFRYVAYTAPEAARVLGLSIGVQDDDRYADPLHAAWIGRKSSFVLPMKSDDFDAIANPRKYASLAALALVLGFGYLGFQTAVQAQSRIEVRNQIEDSQIRLRKVTAEYEAEVAKLEALGIDIKLIQGTVATFEGFEKEKLDILKVLQNVGNALGDDLRLDEITIRRDETARARAKKNIFENPYAQKSAS